MKSLTKFYLIALCLAVTLGPCDKPKPDITVFITYQHLANFQSWALDGKTGSDAYGMWHVYMLRGIVNQGKDAKPFNFDVRKLATESGETVSSNSRAMTAAFPSTMPTDFTVTVKPQEAYTIPVGTGALFFIKQENDTERTPVTHLVYRIRERKSDEGPVPESERESVIMYMLEAETPVMYETLNEEFLEDIRKKREYYENAYYSDGKKKP